MPRRVANIGDVRKLTSGARATLGDFTRALKAVRQIQIRAAQKAGREVHKTMGERYEASLYADAGGSVVPIKAYGAKHRTRKKLLKLDMRKGVMRKGVLKTIKSPLCFRLLPDGYDLDIKRPNLLVTGRARLGKKKTTLRRFVVNAAGARGVRTIQKITANETYRVNDYIDHFADRKAPGLGSPSRADVAMVNQRVSDASSKHLATIRGATREHLTKRAAAKLTVKFGTMLGAA